MGKRGEETPEKIVCLKKKQSWKLSRVHHVQNSLSQSTPMDS